MSIRSIRTTPAVLGACSIALAACGDGHDSRPHSTGVASAGGAYGSSAASGSQPALVDVDANQTLTANPGAGVGVYTEYRTGGHWHVWWTCDTSLTNLSCNFQIGVSVANGQITSVVQQSFQSNDSVAQSDPTQFSATTTTTTVSQGVTFDTAPGATITLDAQVDGQRQVDGQSFLFFVQNGQPNGGYTGSVADPLMLESPTP